MDGRSMKAASSQRRWDDAHSSSNPLNNMRAVASPNIPAHLYTDENPATTIKGTGFKNRRIAQRTIELTSQRGVRYKQYWTIRAMRERAAHHPHQTAGMRDAMAVFDEWLSNYTEPAEEERKGQREEWESFRMLCKSDGNSHSYGKNPSKEELDRARNDVSEGQRLLFQLLSGCGKGMHFPLTCFVAVFGGPGLHGYGKHAIDNESNASLVDISGIDAIEELLGSAKTRKLTLTSSCQVQINYHRRKESAYATIQQSMPTLKDVWGKSAKLNEGQNTKRKREDASEEAGGTETSWSCLACTYLHTGKASTYLVCEVCGSQRSNDTTK